MTLTRSVLSRSDDPAALGLALGDEQALGTYANRTVEVAQHAGGQADATAPDGRLRIQANPLAYGLAVQVHSELGIDEVPVDVARVRYDPADPTFYVRDDRVGTAVFWPIGLILVAVGLLALGFAGWRRRLPSGFRKREQMASETMTAWPTEEEPRDDLAA